MVFIVLVASAVVMASLMGTTTSRGAPPAPCAVHIHHTLGCYNDSDWRSGEGPVLPLYQPSVAGPSLSLEHCAAACHAAGTTGVFGVEAGTRCFCGSDADTRTPAAAARIRPKTECLGACHGSPTEKECGGVGRLLVVEYTCDSPPPPGPHPPPPYHPPPRQLPTINGSSFPGWQAVFITGECDADDTGTPGYGPHHLPGADGGIINLNKRCYSCFRIPSITVNPKTGTLHAFAEARRGDVDGSHCPDIPDARLAYKRSINGGASWSPLRILEEVVGRCRAQPTPVFDNVTDMLILAFNDNCNDFQRGNPTTPYLTTSADDGLTWTNAAPMAVAKPGTGVFGHNVVIGLSRGLVLFNASLPSKTRLIVPAETGTLFSDDHGATWTAVPDNGIGEGAIARCTPGACGGAPGGSAKFAMAVREGPPDSVSIKFSNDSLHWTRPRPIPGIAPYSSYGQAPGLVATPGGLVLSHGGRGAVPPLFGVANLTGHGDGNGCDLFESVDGINWTLRQHIWPFQTGYTTMVETKFDVNGGAEEFALIIESGGLMESDQVLVYFNFTSTGKAPPLALRAPLVDTLPPSPPKRVPSQGPPYVPQARQLPTINGSSFPGWQAVFMTGECDADDTGTPGYGPHHLPGADGGIINLNKRCYSCFRIPSITVNPKTGTLHAFAEARRGDVDGSHCPDIPDARLAYKRSINGGASWSPLRILEEVVGRCRAQPTPVFDNVTDMLILAFNDNCNDFQRGNPTTPYLTTSADDGLTWTNAAPMAVAKPGTGVFGHNVVIGLSRGLVLFNASLPSKTRLIVPAETGTLFSDDHGATWTAVPDNGIGEGAIARCTPGACGGAPGGSAKFAMAVREGPPDSVSIKFSNDSLHWTRPRPIPGIAPYSSYGQAPGLVATPGGLVLSHGGRGAVPPLFGVANLTGHGDGNGCDLFESVDGINWTLRQHIWPFQTGYTTMVETKFDVNGGAEEFALIIESGGLMESDQMLAYFNFSA